MTTGEKIKNARQNTGYTQEQLAEKLSVSRQAIAKWESDRGVPDIENLKAISAFFNVSVDSLLDTQTEIPAEPTPAPAPEPEVVETAAPIPPAPTKQKAKKSTKIIIVAVALLAVLAILLVVFVPIIINSLNFQKGLNLMKEGKYEEAAQVFQDVDSAEANEKTQECWYELAKQEYAKGNYPTAIKGISVLNYKDSADLHNAWRYEYALVLTKDKNYGEAMSLFLALGEYKDAKEKNSDLHYPYAVQLYNKKEFNQAAFYFSLATMNDDLNSSEMQEYYKRAQYNNACEFYNKGDYGLAYNNLNTLVEAGYGDYQNAGEKAKELLQNLLLAGASWKKTETCKGEKLEGYLFFTFTSQKTQCTLTDVSTGETVYYDSCESTFRLPTDSSRKEGINGVYLEGIGSGTFYFIGNYTTMIHMHDSAGECNDLLCGEYESLPTLSGDYSFYEVVFGEAKDMTYDFSPLPEPAIPFADELPADKPVAEGTPSATTTTTAGSAAATTTTTTTVGAGGSTAAPTASATAGTTAATTQGQKPTTTAAPSTTAPAKTTSTPTKTTAADPCAGGHAWVENRETVHHEEVGHYEQQENAVKVTAYKCAMCYTKFKSLDEYYSHFDSKHSSSSNSSILRDRYETAEDWEYTYEDVWVVDEEAYDEIIVVSRTCSRCGKTEEF